MTALVRRYAKHTEDFHRKFTLPQEDRHKFTSATVVGWLSLVPIAEYHAARALPTPKH
jgi:hypothetical protein